jgi:hypothetical protein
MNVRTLLLLLLLSTLALATDQASPEYKHKDYFEHYEGTKTCLQCHQKEAESFFHSQHYQWKGAAPHIANAKGRALGKMNTINDFCTNPGGANWIGLIKNKEDEVITRGCSACHAGLGEKPSETMTQGQLENIDCLQCHASGYRRDVYEKKGGGWEWKPILWQNQEGLDSVSKRISLPQRAMCLRCHASSGGGPNFKRGDIEYALANTDRDYDVHMGTDGLNFDCVQCHKGEDHRIKGRGTDLSANDTPGMLRCGDCHGQTPHKSADLNRHTARVNCTVCHIPSFARTDATDMFRDWSKPNYHKDTDRYSATIQLVKDVPPVYAWYNGNTREQFLGEPLKKDVNGNIEMMVPEGSRADDASKIFAFKVHRAKLPVLDGKGWVIPIDVEEFFQNGELDHAVKAAAESDYGVKNASYQFQPTIRYMGVFHGVRPAKYALSCKDCHGENSRMDWKQLGYGSDPAGVKANK